MSDSVLGPRGWPNEDVFCDLFCDPVNETLPDPECPVHNPPACKDCGKPTDTFACKIRHVQVNTGWAKSAND